MELSPWQNFLQNGEEYFLEKNSESLSRMYDFKQDVSFESGFCSYLAKSQV